MARIELVDWPHTLENSGETVLDTMMINGVPFPFSCGAGDCGACKGHVLQGKVEHLPCPESTLSKEERDQGLVLACRCTPKSDIRLQTLGELVHMPPVVQQFGRVVHQEVRGGGVAVIRVALRKAVEFRPGQYFMLKFGALPARAYSVASVPGSTELEFHIRRVEGGKTSTLVTQPGLTGQYARVEGPYGHGYWREQHAGPIVAIGGGTGLAPMWSIVLSALSGSARREVHLYYAARTADDCYWEQELVELARRHPHVRLHNTLSRLQTPDARAPIPQRAQRVTDALREDFKSLAGAKLYIAGPPAQVAAVSAVARELGLDNRDLHTDPFSDNPEHHQDSWFKRTMHRWHIRREARHWRHHHPEPAQR